MKRSVILLPTQAEAQANREKINELLNSLRAAGIINT
jgi:hypothetical protein